MVSHRTRDHNRSTEAWRAYAPDLARWSWRFVNRIDVWGSYRSLHERGKEFTRTDGRKGKLGMITTRPAKANRGKVLLTESIIVRHYEGWDVGHLVGLHTTSPEITSRWGAAEIDWHGPASTGPEVNLAATLGWYEKLRNLGFQPLLIDSNGAGGYHLRFLFTEPVPTPRAYAFLRWLVNDHRNYGLPTPPEVFPKQPQIDAQNPYGNWLRLPGRHHTRDHWSQVWDGARWLEGTEAIHHILTLSGDPPGLIPVRITPFEARPNTALSLMQEHVPGQL